MKVSSNKIGDIRRHYRKRLEKTYDELEADSMLFQVLMEYTGYSKAELLTRQNEPISESQLLNVHFAIEDLEKGKPIQYVIGRTEFYGLPFIVNSKVLIPRPETEELVDRVLKTVKLLSKPTILDIGTGSGCIAIAIKINIPDAIITAIDVSEFALEIAQQNAALNDLDIFFKKIDIANSEHWSALGNFDIVVSNPPYVRDSEKKEMKNNVINYEPSLALYVPDDNPLIFYSHIARLAKVKLNKGGFLFCEINQYLPHETKQLFVNDGFENVEVYKDLFDNFRVLSCNKKT